jgi:hypothetical protein
MEVIKDTVHNVIKGLMAARGRSCADDPRAWLKKTLTTKELRHIQCNYFKKGILSLSVDSSGWLYNLNLQKEELLARIKKHSSAVKEIRFHIGEVK